ncbi:MAG TPA: VWA domain-containing protein [Methyloceanibacter sp.]|nr:VWA domain-containing protein [Methyloceanibacter sp.]
MLVGSVGNKVAKRRQFRFAIIAGVGLLTGTLSASSAEEEKKPSPCTEDAMIVFDASGSMSGNQVLGIPNSKARIDEVRAALAVVLPTATAHRRVGLITYGPGQYNQCNVKLDLKPTPDAGKLIMSAINALVPAGKTPLTSAVEQAAEVLNYRSKPGVIVVITDGEETCGRSPCALAKQLRLAADQLTVHVIGFRYDGFSWTGGNSVMDLMCLAHENKGIYARANSEEELIEALSKTLDCPMVSEADFSRLDR